ncbi:hypothetical protein [Sphingomonas colocasiae]|uniref:Extradiol ring-cleavage dioxygenase class III enzyme subunit B domain-containing protein n=1 Tax=Sphingomonas colocasiae TaxID=1848973 RepID=A0ABS7PKX3_9SPHN|nr:hypothetical protein [Sphingomonas colocasiae]MBY8821963.1 hypothetical protein [Sphingomonas colocasiae]
MGSIVGAFGTAHILMKRGTGGDAGERVFAGMKEIGRRARALRPDLLVIVSSDHFYNYHADEAAGFAVSPAAIHVPFGDMQLPRDSFPGDSGFARGLAAHAGRQHVDVKLLDGYRPDHGVVIPALMADKTRSIPIVPLISNTGRTPPPAFAEAWRLGVALRDYVEQATPPDLRVVVIGTGGLSHWLGVEQMGRINPDFDAAVLDALTSGRPDDLTAWDEARIVSEGGNGGLEVMNWLVMAGAAGGSGGERVYYEAVPEWITGMGGVELFVNEGGMC